MNPDHMKKIEDLLGNPSVNLQINSEVAGEIYKMYRKNTGYFERVRKTINRICCNPEHAEKLTGSLKGYRSKHIGGKVIIFRYENRAGIPNIYIDKFDEHDAAYCK